MSKGRLVAIGVGVFALICLVFTYDFSRGRITETKSPIVADVLAAASGRDCGRDATEMVLLHIPLGTEQPEAERRLNSIEIVPPRPWFWTPSVENATRWNGDTLEALHTIKATAFGSNLLRVHLTFADEKLTRLAAEVVCRFV